MATDEERLVVTLEARVRDFERNFAKAQQTSDRRLKAIEDRAKTSATRLKATFASIGQGLTGGLGLVAGTAGISGLGFAGLMAGAKAAASDLARMAAEAQKAGVAVEAFQELGYAAKGALVDVDALTDGLKEMQLRADEFIVTGAGGGAEAFQRLGYTADQLKEKLADPAALFEEIIDKLGRLDKAAQIRISDELFGGTGGEQFVRILDQGAGYIARMRQEARDTGNVLDAGLVQRAVEINRQFDKLAATIGTELKGALVGVVALMRDFTDMLNSTESQTGDTLKRRIDLLRAAADNMRKSSLAYAVGGGEQGIQQREAEIAQLEAELAKRPKTSVTVSKPPTGNLGDLSKVQTAASQQAQQLAKAYDGIVLSAQQRIDQMATEQQALGLTTREAETLRVKQDLLAEAQRAGITLTKDQADKLYELAVRTGAAAAAMEMASTANARLAASMDEVRGLSYDVLAGLSDDLRSGVSAADALDNALNRVLDRLIDIGLQGAITGLFGAAGTGSAGSLGSLFSSVFGGFRAAGGPVSAGTPYVVGERGPEMIVPSSPGFVIPNHALGGGSSGGTNITIVNQAPGVEVEAGPAQPNAAGGVDQQLIVRMVRQVMRDDVERRGDIAQAMERRYNLRRGMS